MRALSNIKIKIKTNYRLLDLYLISVALLTLDVVLSVSVPLRAFYLPLHPLIMIVIYAIICLQLYGGRYNRSRTLIGCILMILGILNFTLFHRNWFLYLSYILFFIEGRDISKIIKVVFKCLFTVITINFICFFISYFAFPYLVNVKYSNNIIRYDMFCGDHPNFAGRYWIFAVIAWFSLYYEKLNWRKWLVLFSLTGIVYYFIRSDALLLVLVIYILWVFRKRKTIIISLRFFARYGIAFMLLISCASLWMKANPYLKEIYILLDLASTGRLTFTDIALHDNNVSLFGKEFIQGMQTANSQVLYYVDNAYIYALLFYGAIYILILAVMIYLAAPKMNYKSLICITIFLLYGLIENGIFDVVAIVPLILVAESLYMRKIRRVAHIEMN